MVNHTQEERRIGVETPLGTDKLLLTSFTGEEGLSQLFRFELEFLSSEAWIDPKDIVGKQIDFYVEYDDGEPRWFNGYVNQFTYAGQNDRVHLYSATVVPWLWFLTKGSDCREHENNAGRNAQDIIDGLLGDLGFSDYQWDLQRTPEKRNYCVQYRETHYEFMTRLLSEEGIFYYFKHEEGKHELILTDHVEGVYDTKDTDLHVLNNLSQPEVTDNLTGWNHVYEFTTGKFTHTDYDFEKPTSSLEVKKNSLVSLTGNSGLEYYDHPGRYVDKSVGDALAQLRMEQEETAHDNVYGTSNCRSFSPGGRFELTKHVNENETAGKWVLTHVKHSVSMGGSYLTGGGAAEGIYDNEFRCLPADVVFRPAHIPRPQVHGIQSAVVVGPPGEEIWPDEFGRIKIQYHWDRVDNGDDASSFWVRATTPWAGSGWGMINIPRIGQEVVVEFLEGDPDRPVVTGMLYNKDNMPPYSLPDNKTQSGIKSRSTLGGGEANFNEIRFEDKIGSEEMYIHAEKDQTLMVENDRSGTVGHDETLAVINNRTRTVGINETISVGSNRTHSVGSNETITVGVAQMVTVGAAQTITVGAAQATTVGASQSNTVGVSQSNDVGVNQTESIGSNQTITVGANHSIQIGKDQSTQIGDNQTIKIGKKLSIDAGDEISIVTGKAKLVMKKDGTIQISGKDISVKGTGKIDVKASKDIVMKGKKILQN